MKPADPPLPRPYHLLSTCAAPPGWPDDQQMTHLTFSLTPGQTQGQARSPLICKVSEGPPCTH